MIRLVLFSGLLCLTACASASVAPPIEKSINRSSVVSLPYEDVWRNSVAWFANRNIIIDKIQKESGLITAKYKLTVTDNVIDCGRIELSGVIGTPEVEKYANLNVVLVPSGGSTSATMNIFGDFVATGRDAWDGRLVKVEGKCVSTGVLESLYFREVS